MDNQAENQKEEKGYYGVGSFLWEIIKVFFLALIIITPIRVFLFQPFFVEGASMEPNFKDGDYLIVNELGYKETAVDLGGIHFFSVGAFKDLQRGDIVVFRYPKEPSKFFIKRVIGLPGEKVKVSGGKVEIINAENPSGSVLDESSYLPKGTFTPKEVNLALGREQYFVMGDNRGYSFDSRDWGPVPQNDIVGKVLLRAWPFNTTQVY